MRRLFENVCLTNGILQVVVFDEELFAEHFHGKRLLAWIAFAVHLEDFSERTLTKYLHHFERIESDTVHAIVIKLFFLFLDHFRRWRLGR